MKTLQIVAFQSCLFYFGPPCTYISCFSSNRLKVHIFCIMFVCQKEIMLNCREKNWFFIVMLENTSHSDKTRKSLHYLSQFWMRRNILLFDRGNPIDRGTCFREGGPKSRYTLCNVC